VITWLLRAWRNRHDPTAIMQTRPQPVGSHSFDLAVAAKRRADQRSVAKRKLEAGAKPKRLSNVVPLQAQRRAGRSQ